MSWRIATNEARSRIGPRKDYGRVRHERGEALAQPWRRATDLELSDHAHRAERLGARRCDARNLERSGVFVAGLEPEGKGR